MRPIDADALKRDLIDNRSFYPVIVKNAISATLSSEQAPTIDVTELIIVDPCDVCAYNPPSSFGGKPCGV